MNFKPLLLTLSMTVITATTFLTAQAQTPKGACQDLMVTEIKFGKEVDANGNITAINHSVELFNTTDSDVDLGQYTLELVPDVGTPTVMYLSGNIASHDTYVLTHVNSNNGLIALADAVEMLLQFDGKVSIELKKGTVVKDKIGKEGVNDIALDIDLNALIADPIGYLENAEIDLGSIENLTIKRKPIVQKGKSNFDVESFINEWDVYPESFSQGLGEHSNACVAPVINWRDNEMEIVEANTGVFPWIAVIGDQPNDVWAVIDWDVDPTPGAVQITTTGFDQDAYYIYDGQNDIILFGSLGNFETFISAGTVSNDTEPEPTESFAMYLCVTSGGSSDWNNPLIVKILDDDGLSIQESEINSDIEVYPSVFTDRFVASSINPDIEIISITMVDVTGRSLFVEALDSGTDQMTIHVSDLSAGYVSAVIRTNKGLVAKKLLKID